MSPEKNSSSFGLANYLSPTDIRKAMQLTKKIKTAKKVEEVLRYQKHLAFLMAKAERNKRDREKMIRHQALELKKLNREQLKERYLPSSVKPIEIEVGMSTSLVRDPAEEVVEATKFRWESDGESIEIPKARVIEVDGNRRVKAKAPDVRQVQDKRS